MVTAVTSLGRSGLSDWVMQRVTALVLLSYTLFITGVIFFGPTLSYAEWKALFTRHPTRFLLGSDTWVNERWASYPAIMGGYRPLLGELPREVAQRIAWGNAAALFNLSARAGAGR